MTAADEKNEKSEKSEMTMAAPVVPAGGTQSLAGSETYDSYANSQMGRLTRIVAVHAGVSQPSTSQMLAERLAEGGSEDVPEQEIKRFVRLNLPIHSGYAAVYVVADLWLLAGLL